MTPLARPSTKLRDSSVSAIRVDQLFPSLPPKAMRTAFLYLLRDLKEKNIAIDDQVKKDICASFQKAAVDVLVSKTIRAAEQYDAKSVLLSGGVSANRQL